MWCRIPELKKTNIIPAEVKTLPKLCIREGNEDVGLSLYEAMVTIHLSLDFHLTELLAAFLNLNIIYHNTIWLNLF